MTDSWLNRALCKEYDTNLFFPADNEKPRDKKSRETQAKEVCKRCEVTQECLRAGIGEVGIWGGLTDSEREQIAYRQVIVRVDSSPQAITPVVESVESGNWYAIEATANVELWQRHTKRTWHGCEWAVVKNGQIVEIVDSLDEGYIKFQNLIH